MRQAMSERRPTIRSRRDGPEPRECTRLGGKAVANCRPGIAPHLPSRTGWLKRHRILSGIGTIFRRLPVAVDHRIRAILKAVIYSVTEYSDEQTLLIHY